jgi:hypothetical protein
VALVIASAAYFQICEGCHGHGRIIFSDGSYGRDVCSIKAGLVELERVQSESRFTKEEIPELRRQIMRSVLPYHDDDAGVLAKLCAIAINAQKAEASEEEFSMDAKNACYIN